MQTAAFRLDSVSHPLKIWVKFVVDVSMAKHQEDRTTLDLFAEEKRPGRPKTNPLPRALQLKVNKRNQLKRDKANGLRRVELKVEAELLDRLNELAKQQNMSRADLIQWLLKQHIETVAGHQLQD